MPTILLVEDNELNRDMLSRRLVRRGYDVITALDGTNGHAIACSRLPDVILMDIGLPDIDGWQVTRLLKANAQTRGIPIIALTAHALVTDREKARAEVPGLILMDMSLPILDGWEATRQIKADPATSGIPIIALTAHAMSEDRERAISAGCDDYDTKPVEFARLIQKIETLLVARGAA